jgi:lysophospholipase L1-like esterase
VRAMLNRFGLLLAIALAACGSPPAAAPVVAAPSSATADPPEIYAAIGASETAGLGINDQPLRLRAAWPQLFFNEALPRSATYYNFAVPGITTPEALSEEVPSALRVHPTVVTVFLGGNDVFDQVDTTIFETNLRGIVETLRQGGRATVLVANLPPLEQLPAVRACLPGAAPDLPACLIGHKVGTPAQLEAVIAAYDAAVARIVKAAGATLVDLSSEASVLQANPDYVASDGFHPSPLGHLAIAQLFLAAFRPQAIPAP